MKMKNKVRKIVGVVSASVMIMMMLGVVYADGVSEPRSYYCLAENDEKIPIPLLKGGFGLPIGVSKPKVAHVHIDNEDGYTSIRSKKPSRVVLN